MIIEVNGVSLHVEDHGKDTPVPLIHCWPDSAHLWRHRAGTLILWGKSWGKPS